MRVTSPLSRIKDALDQIHPNNGVNFDNQGETIVLTGTVRSGVVAEDARRLAVQQVNGNPSKVISNIRVDAPTQVQLRVKVAAFGVEDDGQAPVAKRGKQLFQPLRRLCRNAALCGNPLGA